MVHSRILCIDPNDLIARTKARFKLNLVEWDYFGGCLPKSIPVSLKDLCLEPCTRYSS